MGNGYRFYPKREKIGGKYRRCYKSLRRYELRKYERYRKTFKKNILEILKKIYNKEFIPNTKKLKGYEFIFRVRVGNFRIIYFDDNDKIILKAIKKRDESTYSDF